MYVKIYLDYNEKGYRNKIFRKFERDYIVWIYYVSSSMLCKNKKFIQESPRKVETVLAIPFGWMLTKYICGKANK